MVDALLVTVDDTNVAFPYYSILIDVKLGAASTSNRNLVCSQKDYVTISIQQ